MRWLLLLRMFALGVTVFSVSLRTRLVSSGAGWFCLWPGIPSARVCGILKKEGVILVSCSTEEANAQTAVVVTDIWVIPFS